MIYSLHPGAERDVADALDFYNEHAGPAVAERFLEEFERIAKLLVEHPDLGHAARFNSYPRIRTSAGRFNPDASLRIISSVSGRTRFSTSATLARGPMYGSTSLLVIP